MKKHYYINTNQQSNGDYEVHEDSCKYLPVTTNRVYLGSFYSCEEAVAEAKRLFPAQKNNINGCYYCSNACHTS
ncbi:hypothetical protein RAH57_10470 [Chryseobacterium sp. CKR4-1]|uniref:hypothetical protein n=1 Tax=Chryseobacterium sp. CKR4-1 TaxID=3068896 RepID=UPI002796502D|nr:hypothetical protein [Chryseobacterium sp. CKR4-1]MDQ1804415.1 hypothetical protein [Chryseobacterium sp. CKR4-1]